MGPVPATGGEATPPFHLHPKSRLLRAVTHGPGVPSPARPSRGLAPTLAPSLPGAPLAPRGPWGPGGPWTPRSPGKPLSPWRREAGEGPRPSGGRQAPGGAKSRLGRERGSTYPGTGGTGGTDISGDTLCGRQRQGQRGKGGPWGQAEGSPGCPQGWGGTGSCRPGGMGKGWGPCCSPGRGLRGAHGLGERRGDPISSPQPRRGVGRWEGDRDCPMPRPCSPALTCSPGLPASPGGPAGPGRPWGGRRGAMRHHGGEVVTKAGEERGDVTPSPGGVSPREGRGRPSPGSQEHQQDLVHLFLQRDPGGEGRSVRGGSRLPSPVSGGRARQRVAEGLLILTVGPGGPWAPASPSLPAAPCGRGRRGCSEHSPDPQPSRAPAGPCAHPGRGAGLDAAVASFEGWEKPRRAARSHVTSLLSPLQSHRQPPGWRLTHLSPLPSRPWSLPSPQLRRQTPAPRRGKPPAEPPAGWPGSGRYSRQRRGAQELLSRRVCQAHPENKRAG